MVILPGRRLGFIGNDAYTNLLIHGDAHDSSRSKHIVTMNGSVAVSTTKQKFTGHPSLYFPGGVGDYVSIAHSADWYPSSSYTLDLWFYLSDWPAEGAVWNLAYVSDDATHYINFLQIYNNSGTKLFGQGWDNASGPWGADRNPITVGITFSLDVWYHAAFTHHNNTHIATHLNGKLLGTDGGVSLPDTASGLIIGQNFKGYMQEIRVSPTTERWTYNADFTPQESPYR